MEEGAPPLMADEAPPVKGGEQFEMMAALRERKHNYWSDWKTRPLTMLWQHLALPLFVVFFIVNRLVVWSAQTVKWPPEVKPTLGVPVTEADVEADRTHKLRADSPSATPCQPRKKKHRCLLSGELHHGFPERRGAPVHAYVLLDCRGLDALHPLAERPMPWSLQRREQ